MTRERVPEYRRASLRQRGEILDQLASLNGWTRHYAGWLLRCWGRAVYCWQDGERVLIVVGRRRPIQSRRRYYDQPVYVALKRIWECYGWMCGKRLVGVLRHQLAVLEKFGAISLEPEVRAKLERISADDCKRGRREVRRRAWCGRRYVTRRTVGIEGLADRWLPPVTAVAEAAEPGTAAATELTAGRASFGQVVDAGAPLRSGA